MALKGWRLGIACTKAEINIDILMNSGQSFRWKRNELGWIGVIGDHLWRLHQTELGIFYRIYGQKLFNKCAIGDVKHLEGKSKQPSNNLKKKCKHQKDVVLLLKNEMSKSGNREISSLGELEVKTEQKQRKSRKSTSVSIPQIEMDRKECQEEIEQNSVQLLPGVSLCETLKREVMNEVCVKEDKALDRCDHVQSMFSSEDCTSVLRDYFQVDVDLRKLYDYWSSQDPHFKKVAPRFEGIRMLRQDPTENLLSFVCSSNNHISRISSMVEKLCVHYGEFIAEVDGERYYSFPSMTALTGDGVEGHLRQLGFGYRAKFISAIARHVTEKEEEGWLESLREKSYQEAKTELLKLLGVGAKVADCVCLMSLDKHEAVPVDTHVWQIAAKNYMAKLQTAKSLTDKLYNEIGDFYRKLWGPYAGWAQSVMFTSDLKQNKSQNSDKKPSQDKRKAVGEKRKNTCSKTNNKATKGSKRMKEGT